MRRLETPAIQIVPRPHRIELSPGGPLHVGRLLVAGNEWPASRPVLGAIETVRRLCQMEGADLAIEGKSGAAPVKLELIRAQRTWSLGDEGHTLTVEPGGVRIESVTDRGAFYALQSLLQLLRTTAGRLPCVRISDAPDYPVRGYYYDVSRGKVPTLATLRRLVDAACAVKLNHLELYIEHTFAFSAHPAIWEGSDPLTAEEILELDTYCRDRCVDLVPSLSTFGHFYGPLTKKRYAHLNELPIDASHREFSWWDHMHHYTLDPSNPQSLALVGSLIDELCPLFSSASFNICCDETWDLGQGRSRARAEAEGVGGVYFQFLKQVMDRVRAHGKVPMFWGDIVTKHPELVPLIPRDVVCLDWDYSPDLLRTRCERFAAAHLPFYVCPGIQSWLQFQILPEKAVYNLGRFARRGLENGAAGILTTDWGDRGHPAPLVSSLIGIALAGDLSWHVDRDVEHSDRRREIIESAVTSALGAGSGAIGNLLMELERAILVNWGDFTTWIDPSTESRKETVGPRTGAPAAVARLSLASAWEAIRTLKALLERLVPVLPAAKLESDELVLLFRSNLTFHRMALVLASIEQVGTEPLPITAPDVADELRTLELEFSRLWHERNKPSEYFRLRAALLEFARRLDACVSWPR